MKTQRSVQSLVPFFLLAAPAAWAQSEPSSPPGLSLEPPPAASPNRFGLSYRMGLNASVNFKNLGGYTFHPSRLTPNGDPYNYDDGYVYNDINNGAFGYTWYWGYDAAPGQYTLGSGNLLMHRSSSQANQTSTESVDDPSSGFEVTYNRELYHSRHVRCGLEAAFGYTPLSVNDSRPRQGDVTVATDAYAVPLDPESGYGITYFPVQTPGPYQHDKVSNGPLIGNTPTPLPDQVDPGGATITGTRRFSANLYGFRLGPYMEFPLSRRFTFGLSGGFALAYIESDFSFNETVSITGAGSQSNSGSGSTSGWQPGGYVAGTFSYAFAKNWAAAAGAQFLDMGQYTQTTGGKQATLDLRQALFVTLGVTYSF